MEDKTIRCILKCKMSIIDIMEEYGIEDDTEVLTELKKWIERVINQKGKPNGNNKYQMSQV